MKQFVSCLIILIITISFCSCADSSASNVIVDNSENSSFVDFYTEDNQVYIECSLNIYYSGSGTNKIKISAVDEDDVKIGLLKSSKLTAIDKATGEDTFTLEKGENTISVLFVGDYAGIYQISKREIPRFIYIEKA